MRMIVRLIRMVQIRLSTEPGRKHTLSGQLDETDASNLRMRGDLVERLLRRHRVEVEHGDGLAPRRLPADRHLGDVDIVLAEQGADETDQAGNIAVAEQKQHAIEMGVEAVGPQMGEAQLPVAEQGAGGPVLLAVGMNNNLKKRTEIAFFRGTLLDQLDAALGSEHP